MDKKKIIGGAAVVLAGSWVSLLALREEAKPLPQQKTAEVSHSPSIIEYEISRDDYKVVLYGKCRAETEPEKAKLLKSLYKLFWDNDAIRPSQAMEIVEAIRTGAPAEEIEAAIKGLNNSVAVSRG